MPKEINLKTYELASMNKEEIQSIPAIKFSNFQTNNNRKVLSTLPIETWDMFTYEQLEHMNIKVFVYLKDNILDMLSNKFKDNNQLIKIKKYYNKKSIEILSEPLTYRIENARKERNNYKQRLNEAEEAYKELLNYNSQDLDVLIPKRLIRQALMGQVIFDDVDDSSDMISKRDYLRWLETKCQRETHLDEIPQIVKFNHFAFEYDVFHLLNNFENYIRCHLNDLDLFSIKYEDDIRNEKNKYLKREDIAKIIAEL